MFSKVVSKFFLTAGLLVVIVLSAASVSKAESTAASQNEPPSLHDNPMHPSPTPEPVTMLLFGTGLLGVGAIARRRLRRD